MRKLVLLIIVGLAVGAFFGHLMMSVPGYWLIRVGDTSVQTSFWFGLVLLLGAFIVLHFALRLLGGIIRPVGRFRTWNSRARNRRAMKRTVRGLVALTDGRWKKAEKTLVRAADDSSTPLVNYLSAALAAHYQGHYETSQEHLNQAQLTTEGADTAIGLMQAQLMIDRQQPEDALAILNRLDKKLTNHPQVLKLLKQVHLSVNDWDGLRRLVPRLAAQKLISPTEREQLEYRAYRELIVFESKNPGDVERVRSLWADMPDYLRANTELIVLYTEALVQANEEPIAERLLSHSLDHHWDARLVKRYGLLNVDARRQLAKAEQWLQERPNDPELLLACGRLSLRTGQWSKAQEYFEASQRQRPNGVVCAELARLYASLGEHNKSQLYYRHSVEMLAKSLPSLPQPSNSSASDGDASSKKAMKSDAKKSA
ncbi:heme biosynthesis HemY N-terminal domain-containing protein [Halomonas llamarensis]|uniref:Tetratricopeptide repeat protein n=1 Tax=Halomonas llamarensis TaxID=2945104 RepID=A0ABT0SLR6_9GAMM|nr:heme biosynthesis HemY N-terminal domain-containing protein [Halomonas llamarensis]MCL7928726.1 tetratricopeptide repeat protein [Halomonas llamarensis]